jgi:hypothetical protein
MLGFVPAVHPVTSHSFTGPPFTISKLPGTDRSNISTYVAHCMKCILKRINTKKLKNRKKKKKKELILYHIIHVLLDS